MPGPAAKGWGPTKEARQGEGDDREAEKGRGTWRDVREERAVKGARLRQKDGNEHQDEDAAEPCGLEEAEENRPAPGTTKEDREAGDKQTSGDHGGSERQDCPASIRNTG